MMTIDLLQKGGRWTVVSAGFVGSLLPALFLTAPFAQTGAKISTFVAYWVEIVIGPIKYWLTALLGPDNKTLDPMSGITGWIYLASLLLILSHPVKPRILTAWMSALGFCIWYGWVFLTIAAFEY